MESQGWVLQVVPFYGAGWLEGETEEKGRGGPWLDHQCLLRVATRTASFQRGPISHLPESNCTWQ